MSKTFSHVIVIGVSAGAVETLSRILPELPADYPLPILIVIHLPQDKKSVMPELLQSKSKIVIKEAEDKEPIQGGTAYIAPPDYHLLVEKNGLLSLSSEEPVWFSRPSIDVLFETAADSYGKRLIGIVLTGASNDGALGLQAVIKFGGTGIVQDPETAYMATMPAEALKLNPGAMVMNLEQISSYLQKVSNDDN